ncbi:two-partner secretion domain-containing protein [Ramlibacter humi]|uniref:Filamentous hemagglutinin N-terminal domain-containing protein n=1 Tax=Ramlibacter humi TaxID=2530451 RepID=A0A4Z0BG68_9BURK|nr:hemagglutinin repeat-containing protein [Ramlibacter humi]TFY98326.1 filamentous hemagglutinin N-terminal domain-containing protein [Ramlibacter humi]
MNKNCYRLIFSRARGAIVAVAETASSRAKDGRTGGTRRPPLAPQALTALAFSLACAFTAPTHGQIIANPSAPAAQQPKVIAAPNGVPLVNIQAPSSAGVSHNKYSQFDVSKQGVILNNSTGNVQSQLGGWIQGNAALAGGSAKLILNEVNSSSPSVLKGFIEVAGQRADVVVANPAGITVDGAGFINAARATLTTGVPMIGSAGTLDGFQVRQGLVTVGGAGLDARSTDYTAILARSVVLNGGVWANNLRVVAGSANTNADASQVVPVSPTSSAPAFAIDTAQLGGMYAGYIHLIATEAGVGVRNAGTWGSSGNLVLSAEGLLTNSGTISATGAMSSASKGVTNTGTIFGQTGAAITANGALSNSAVIASGADLSIQATGAGASINSTSASTLAAGVQSDGSIGSAGTLNLSSTGQVTAKGMNLAGADMAVSASNIDLGASRNDARNVTLTATAGGVDLAAATMAAGQRLKVTAAGAVRTDDAAVSSAALDIAAASLSNVHGKIMQTGTADASILLSGALDNAGGEIAGNASNLRVQAGSVANVAGRIDHSGTGTLTVDAAAGLDNRSGVIATSGALGANAGGALTNTAGQIVAAQNAVIAATGIANDQGLIQAGGNLSVDAGSGTLANSNSGTGGGIQSGGNLVVHGGTISNTAGRLSASTDLSIGGGAVTNTGSILAGRDLSVASSAMVSNAAGTMAAARTVDVTATGLQNQAGLIQGGQLVHVDVGAGTLLNAGSGAAGGIRGGGTVDLRADTINNQGGTLLAQTQLSVTAQSFTNDAASTLASLQDAALTVHSLTNAGQLQANRDLSIQSQGTTNTGKVLAGHQLALTGGVLTNNHGLLQAGADLQIQTGGAALINTGTAAGQGILSGGTLTVASGNLTNSAGLLAAATDLDVQAAAVSNTGGTVMAGGAGKVKTTGALNNTGGLVQATGSLTVDTGANALTNDATAAGKGIASGGAMSITAGALSNQSGRIAGVGAAGTTVKASTLNNAGGLVVSSGNLGVTATGTITNTAGTFAAGQDLSATAVGYTNLGKFSAQRDLSLTSQNDLNLTGKPLEAGRDLALQTSGQLVNTGELMASRNLAVGANKITNSGSMDAGSQLTAAAATSIVNTGAIVGASVTLQGGTLVANRGVAALIGATDTAGDLTILAPTIENSDDVTATDTMAKPIILGLGRVTLAGGKTAAGGFTAANEVTNRSAIIESGGNLRMYAANVTNTRRTLAFSGTFDQTLSDAEAAALGVSLSGQVGTVNTPDPTQIGGVYIDPPHSGSMNSDYWYTTYNGVAMRNTLLSISPKAQIISGGNIDTSAGSTWKNYWSDISAAGAINLSGVTLDQDGWKGAPRPQVMVNYSGDYHYQTYKGYWWTMSFADDLRYYAGGPNYDSTFSAGGSIAGSGATIINGAHGASAPVSGGTLGSVSVASITPAAGGTGATVMPGPVPASGAKKPHSVTLDLTVPNSALFHPATSPGAAYLVETDPRFTNYRQWMSSSYMLDALNIDPSSLTKRLGDGFYEQRLVREQLLVLTGQRFVGNYTDEDAQYRSLLANAVTAAKQWSLRPGIALSAAQMEQLTSDIVWLVEQDVTLPSGEKTRALVPVVYLAANSTALRPDGALIAANKIELTDLQGFANSGTIATKDSLKLQTQGDLDNRFGQLTSGGAMVLAAGGNVDLTAARLNAGTLQMDVGRNLLLASATQTETGQALGIARQYTMLAALASIDVKGDATLKVGGNVQQSGADIKVGGNLKADIGGTWTMDTVQTGETKSAYRYGGNASSDFESNRGSSLQVGGSAQIGVGGDFIAKGAMLNLGSTADSTASISAGGSVVFEAAKDRAQIDSSSRTSSHGRSASDTKHVLDERVVGTSVNSGGSLVIGAAKDVVVKGSDVNSQGALTVAAGRDVIVTTESERHGSDSTHSGSHRGLVSSKTVNEQSSFEQVLQQGSSLDGQHVSIAAGQDVKILGSQVISDLGTTIVAARDVAIEAATNTTSTNAGRQETRSGLFGSGGSITLGKRSQENDRQTTSTTVVASTVGSVGGDIVIRAGGEYRQTGSDVMAPVGSIDVAAASVKITEARETNRESEQSRVSQSGLSVGISAPVLSTVQSAAGLVKAAEQTGDGRMQALGVAAAAAKGYQAAKDLASIADAANPVEAAGIGLSISLGSSKSQSTQTAQSDIARGSSVAAGQNVSITATGAGRASNILAQGAEISAGRVVQMKADGDVVLKAAQNTASESSSNSSSSASIGVSIGSSGIGITASASKGSGTGNGSDVYYSNTHVGGGERVALLSGADTTLQGAVVTAPQVAASVGGNLRVESLQDTSSYHSNSQTSGVSVTLTPAGVPVGGSISAGRSSIDSTFVSVGEQSGIRAGDQGFQVSVAGATSLLGSQVTSSQRAVDAGNNIFRSAGGITTADLENNASYSGSAIGVTVGAGKNPAGEWNAQGTSAGVGRDSGSATSVSTAGISGVAGDQEARTGDASTSLRPIFDKSKVQSEIDAQVRITAAFGSEAAKVVGDYANAKYEEARKAGDTAGMEAWAEGGAARVALHAVVGGLTGGAKGAAGAAASQAAIEFIGKEVAEADLPDSVKKALIGLAGTAVGAAAAGTSGAAAGYNATTNNYLSAADLRSRAQRLDDARKRGDVVEEVQILREYALKSAANSGVIVHDSILQREQLSLDKAGLEQLLTDPGISGETRMQATISLREVTRAIAVIDKGPVIADALQAGLTLADVATLGQILRAGGLTVKATLELMQSRVGAEASAEAAGRITTNFYVDRGLDLSPQMYRSAAEASTHNPSAGKVVLGPHVAESSQSYESVAKEMGATFFEMGDWKRTSAILGEDKMWYINREFLDQQIALGKEFLFTVDPRKVSQGSFTWREFDHLRSQGYRLENSGDMYRAVR